MVEAIDSIQHIRQRFIKVRQAFYAWCSHLRHVRHNQAQLRRAAAHHALIHLQGRPLLFWRHWTRVERHSRAKADMEASLKRQQDAVFAEVNARIEAMHAEVARSAALAEREVRLRAAVEKRMKECFLRGVSALNMEAADIIHSAPEADQPGLPSPVVPMRTQIPLPPVHHHEHRVHSEPPRQGHTHPYQQKTQQQSAQHPLLTIAHAAASPATPEAQQLTHQQQQSPCTAPAAYQRPRSPWGEPWVSKPRVGSGNRRCHEQQRQPQLSVRVEPPGGYALASRSDTVSSESPRRLIPQPVLQRHPTVAC
mmetsp:Transcript_8661/g.25995  ORF Transcript_8661/g.25995 Transcript_8661/m.25995 type:complete len:309 (-) Transcript_8661:1491-2417(-)